MNQLSGKKGKKYIELSVDTFSEEKELQGPGFKTMKERRQKLKSEFNLQPLSTKS